MPSASNLRFTGESLVIAPEVSAMGLWQPSQWRAYSIPFLFMSILTFLMYQGARKEFACTRLAPLGVRFLVAVAAVLLLWESFLGLMNSPVSVSALEGRNGLSAPKREVVVLADGLRIRRSRGSADHRRSRRRCSTRHANKPQEATAASMKTAENARRAMAQTA